jgi:hypothetical protein
VVAYPWASNAVGTLVDVPGWRSSRTSRSARLGRRGALRAPRPDRRRRSRGRRPHLLALQVLRPAPRCRVRPAPSCSSAGGPTRCGPRPRFRSATASRRAPSPTSCWPASSRRAGTSTGSAWMRSWPTSGSSGHAFLDGLPELVPALRPPTWTAACRPSASTSRARRRRRSQRGWATAASRSGTATTTRVEAMDRLGLPRRRGSSRDRPLQHERGGRPAARGAARAMRLLVLGGTRFLGRAAVEAALARGHEVTLFNRGETNADALPGDGEAPRRPRRGLHGARRARVGCRSSTRPASFPDSYGTRPSFYATPSATTFSCRRCPSTASPT